jgi:large subunit ribosomal protein L13
MKTIMSRPGTIERHWWVVDAEGVTLGKLAARIALILQGKHRPTYTPHIDTGDFVVVVNADRVALTGKKATNKTYVHYTGHMGGRRERNIKEVLRKHPTEVVYLAVKRMMPKTVLGRRMLKKLKLYSSRDDFDGQRHPHQAQQPTELTI